MSKPKVVFTQMPHAEGLPAPAYATSGSAGFDLRAALPDGSMTINRGDYCLIPTGLKMMIPEGFEAQVRPRSGLAFKHGITVLNSPGTIDSDYRGEIGVLLINYGKREFEIKHGDRIAQLVVSAVQQIHLVGVDKLDKTERGEGGFGSTGVK